MIKFLLDFFRKRPLTLEETLLYPEGKRYYKETHNLKKTQMDEDALKIIHRLSKFGHKGYFVGGCIRDLLLNKKPKDFDIATSATPNQIKNIFNNCRIIGKRFKIVHIIFKGKIIEVTTFRSLPDHRLNKNTSTDADILLKRDNNFGTSKEDAARRDFTVNALYYDPRNESIIDYVGGFEDIQNKILRVVGDPDVSFKEDPVRMLRAIKISCLNNLEIEKKTKTAIKKNRFEIEKASNSRMLEEYNKIFRTWNTSLIFKGLAENNILEVLFKEALDSTKKTTEWQNKFLETKIGKLLLIADRKLKEREELTPVIFFALIFSDIINDALAKEKGNMIPVIKNALEPICNRLEIPKRDRDRLIKIYASQKRFLRANDSNVQQNELFRAKDFFYESFMYFKIISEAKNDEQALQSAFFWEISTRIRPGGKSGKPQNQFHNKKYEKDTSKEKIEHSPSSTQEQSNNNKDFNKDKNKDHYKKSKYNKFDNQNKKHNNPYSTHKKEEDKTSTHKVSEQKGESSSGASEKSKENIEINVTEETRIVNTAEMEALKEDSLESTSKEDNKNSSKTANSSESNSNNEKPPYKKRKFRPKKFRRFHKKKFIKNDGPSEDKNLTQE